MRKLLFSLFILSAFSLSAQNAEFKNAIHAKLNLVDFGQLYNKTMRVSQGFEVGYFRNIASFLNIGIPVKMGLAKLPGISDNTLTASVDLALHVQPTASKSIVLPYLHAGVGLFSEKNGGTDRHLTFGAGFDFRISKFAFVNLQGEYRKANLANRDNVQVGIGFIYLLHKIYIAPPPPPVIDTDKDSIPDLADHCPDQPGPASALGCPDKDGDGLGDAEDHCPDQAGALETNGCPDGDHDGVADKDDKCPTQAGTLNGCPDTDKDGVADKDDHCPDLAGTLEGCPDQDKDGFADKDDQCPTEAGRWNGCPDKDFDGVPDKDDACPNDPGPVAQKGCPEKLDKDKDGVADKDDKCPDQAGTAAGCPDKDADGVADASDPCPEIAGKFNGCPDTDGDGVADNLDKCPTTVGVAASQGCPEIKQETKEKLAFATKMVQFETGKAVLKMQSYAVLDELFNILKQYPDYKLAISGHTDDVGPDETNLNLSAARAKACFDYLTFRGIPEKRLRSAGFGEMRPIASNKTEAGREMNRRVEFELVVE